MLPTSGASSHRKAIWSPTTGSSVSCSRSTSRLRLIGREAALAGRANVRSCETSERARSAAARVVSSASWLAGDHQLRRRHRHRLGGGLLGLNAGEIGQRLEQLRAGFLSKGRAWGLLQKLSVAGDRAPQARRVLVALVVSPEGLSESIERARMRILRVCLAKSARSGREVALLVRLLARCKQLGCLLHLSEGCAGCQEDEQGGRQRTEPGRARGRTLRAGLRRAVVFIVEHIRSSQCPGSPGRSRGPVASIDRAYPDEGRVAAGRDQHSGQDRQRTPTAPRRDGVRPRRCAHARLRLGRGRRADVRRDLRAVRILGGSARLRARSVGEAVALPHVARPDRARLA